MSNALAIGVVTALLKDLLDEAVAGGVVGGAAVSVQPPDRVVPPGNGDDPDQLNLFLYQVTPNLGWRNVGLPSHDPDGRRTGNPPLALDLHYLLTAYGSDDFNAEILLGFATQALHEIPVLSRERIRRKVAEGTVAEAELADQVEQIKISPEPMDSEVISRLWSAFQTAYRPTTSYHVSVVLIESVRPAHSPLPVLTRDITVHPATTLPIPPFATLETVHPPNQHPSALLGETLMARGHNLAGDTVVARLSHRLLVEPIEIQVPPEDRTPVELSIRLPNTPAELPAGTYTLAVVVRVDGQPEQVTNDLPFSLAPRITSDLPTQRARDANGDATLTLSCSPEVRPEQLVSLLVGDREVFAETHPDQTAELIFVIREAPEGEFFLRLRVDGVESRLINRPPDAPPAFDETQKVTIT